MTLFCLMLLCALVDDFVFQPICLSKLKQASYWNNIAKLAKKYPDVDLKKYKYDYIPALFVHSTEWTLMMLLPALLMLNL